MIMLLSALNINFKAVKNMTVFTSLILILQRFTEMGLLSTYGRWNDYVVICIKIYNFKGME